MFVFFKNLNRNGLFNQCFNHGPLVAFDPVVLFHFHSYRLLAEMQNSFSMEAAATTVIQSSAKEQPNALSVYMLMTRDSSLLPAGAEVLPS